MLKVNQFITIIIIIIIIIKEKENIKEKIVKMMI
jgi:hypothetical protein